MSMKKEFLPLKELHDQVWPTVVPLGFATDMTGVSLPILDFAIEDQAHPFRVIFLLYYAVPDQSDFNAPHNITKPYAIAIFDLSTGELIKAENIISPDDPSPLIGLGADAEVQNLSLEERRDLQNLLFSRYDEAARMYANSDISGEQKAHLKDLQQLFDYLHEPPLKVDYEYFGEAFFSWLSKYAMQ